ELAFRPAVEPEQFLALQLKFDEKHRTFGTGAGIAVAQDFSDLRVLEDRNVTLRGLFSLAVEPRARRTLLLHVASLLARTKLPQPHQIAGRIAERRDPH